jgi:hypothetical protein
MNTATAYTPNLSFVGSADVVSTVTEPNRELTIDELVWVGGGDGVVGIK